MTHLSAPRRRRLLAVLTAGALTVVGLSPATPAAAAAPGHDKVVHTVPSTASPDVQDGSVDAIHDAGTKIIAGGSFTRVQNRNSDVDIARDYLLAFDKATGAVDTAFAPTLDNEVTAVTAGPTANTVFVAGKFNTVNGVTRRKVALLDVNTGAVVTSFAPPAFNGLIKDIALVGNRLLVGGIFTTAGNPNPRGGLASLNATTGAVDSYLTTTLTENHNWDGVSGAKAGVGAEKLAVSRMARSSSSSATSRRPTGCCTTRSSRSTWVPPPLPSRTGTRPATRRAASGSRSTRTSVTSRSPRTTATSSW